MLANDSSESRISMPQANAGDDLSERVRRTSDIKRSERCCAEEDGYKRLILAELNRKKLTVGSLERPAKMHRTSLNRIIRGNGRLTEELRQICFVALGIDRHQAYITVAMLKDIAAYHKPSTHLIAQNLRAVQKDVCDARSGKIIDFFKPAIINQAAKVGVDSLLQHQERIEELQRKFTAG